MRNIQKILKSKYGLYVIGGTLATCAILLTITLLIPTGSAVFEKRNSVEHKEKLATSLSDKRRFLESLDTSGVGGFLPEVEIALPSDKDVFSIFTSMENLGLSSQITINSLNLTPGVVSTQSAESEVPAAPSAEEEYKNTNALPFTMEVSASREQLIDFLTRLEKTRRLFDISALNVHFLPDTDVLTVHMDLFAYYQIPVAEIGSVESPLSPWTEGDKIVLEEVSSYPRADIVTVGPSAGAIGKTNLFSP